MKTPAGLRRWLRHLVVLGVLVCRPGAVHAQSTEEPGNAYEAAFNKEPLCYASVEDRTLLAQASAGDRPSLHQLFLRATGSKLDGEAAELYSAELRLLVMEMGEDRFLEELEREPHRIQRPVAWHLATAIQGEHQWRRLARKLAKIEKERDGD